MEYLPLFGQAASFVQDEARRSMELACLVQLHLQMASQVVDTQPAIDEERAIVPDQYSGGGLLVVRLVKVARDHLQKVGRGHHALHSSELIDHQGHVQR